MTLDATVAGTSANAYLTVATADGLATDDLGPEAAAWLALVNSDPPSLAKKEAALKRATREIDAALRTGWPPFTVGQALLFPRSVDVTSSVAHVPTSVVQGCYQQAIFDLANATMISAASTREQRGIQSGSEPNVSFTLSDQDASWGLLCRQARHYLQAFRRASHSDKAGTVRSQRITPSFQGW